jgi:hypothetical protein
VALAYAVAIETRVHRDLTLRQLGQVGLEAARFAGALLPLIAVVAA